MKTEDIATALKEIKLPVRYDLDSAMIFDAVDNHILDVRGWGRLQDDHKQDCIGEYIAGCINNCKPSLIQTPK